MSSTIPDHAQPLMRVTGLTKHFPARSGWIESLSGRRRHVRAVDGIDLDVDAGRTLAVVGESGSGKSTLGRLMMRLLPPTSGKVLYRGRDVVAMNSAELRNFRRKVQIVFQDPYSSLNARMRVRQIIREPLDIYGEGTRAERDRRVDELLVRVGLSIDHAKAFPAELSGGQRQRVGIAAALALSPELIIADEPTSALDVSVQAQTLNLMADLQRDFNLTFVFITHDLGVVQHFSDRVAVMYLGKIVEEAPNEELFANPQHPYSKLLFSAIPNPDPTKRAEWQLPDGDPPSPLDPPPGCAFHPRCDKVMPRCSQTAPEACRIKANHVVSCFLHQSEQQSMSKQGVHHV